MPWAEYKLAREAVYNETIDTVTQRLNARPPGPRNEANDNSIFQPLRDSTVEALKTGDLSLAERMFRECIRRTRQYEHNNNCEIHKGAPTFNVGIAHLRAYDFTAALHYFELAQKETRQTSGKANWNIFLNPLFTSSFWDAIEGAANT